MTQSNGTIYRSTTVKVLGNSFLVLVASGKFNYIEITKVTNNPFAMGKRFDNMDAAVSNYKSAEMRIELLKIETGITALA